MNARPSRLLLASVGVASALLDLATKAWAFEAIPEKTSHEVIGDFLVFQTHWNPHGPWSWGHGWGWLRWALPIISLVAVFVIGKLWLESDPADRVKGLGLVLILGGALGNLHDRVRTFLAPETYRGVRDFILFPNIVFGDPFPTFNLADAWITIGVVLVAWTILFEKKPLEEAPMPGTAQAPPADRVSA